MNIIIAFIFFPICINNVLTSLANKKTPKTFTTGHLMFNRNTKHQSELAITHNHLLFNSCSRLRHYYCKPVLCSYSVRGGGLELFLKVMLQFTNKTKTCMECQCIANLLAQGESTVNQMILRNVMHVGSIKIIIQNCIIMMNFQTNAFFANRNDTCIK